MPGILPMKVIKVGNGAQARIAQACDRCRSKKIRCDGIRPSCTQCVNVGFECKTSDKLSRRAFPRGYTESLEERVRVLEAEVRELQGLLDEKEEKLDLLSRVRMHSPPTLNATSAKASCSPKSQGSSSTLLNDRDSLEHASDDEESFTIVQSPTLAKAEGGNEETGQFMGTSSFRSLMTAFKRRAQERRRGASSIDVDAVTYPHLAKHICDYACSKAPALMLSDRLVNTFFQEFAPMFPILHRPSFLGVYNEYVSSNGSVTDTKASAQLYFAFAIASLSKHSGATEQDVAVLECQGRAALESFISDSDLETVQCLTLATLYFTMKSDWSSMLRYKGQAVSFAQRLGLHQSQKRFSLNPLTVETRSRVFWTLFSLDCFSAAHLGLPTLLHDVDVQCELPYDADEEYITPKGFLPSLPGEFTRVSSALALFRLSKILSRILSELYPSKASHKLSVKKIAILQDELDTWSLELPSHLKLQFEKDKPFTGVVSPRSPILSLAYHYTHTFISRPMVLARPSLSSRASASVISLAASSKRIVQIIDLLAERGLALAFCFGEQELLQQAAIGLVLENLEMGADAKLARDVLARLGGGEFRKIEDVCLREKPVTASRSSHRRAESDSKSQGSGSSGRLSKKDEKRSRASGTGKAAKDAGKPSAEKQHKSKSRKSLPFLPSLATAMSRPSSAESMASICQTDEITSHYPLFARSEPSLSMSPMQHHVSAMHQQHAFMPFTPGPADHHSAGGMIHFAPSTASTDDDGADWVQMLSSLDGGASGNIYDGIYGGPASAHNKQQQQQRRHHAGGPLPPPSLGDYSSLASNSPKTTTSSSSAQHPGPSTTNALLLSGGTCDAAAAADLWSIVPEFPSPIDGAFDAAMLRPDDDSPLSASIEDVGGPGGGIGVGGGEFSLFEYM